MHATVQTKASMTNKFKCEYNCVTYNKGIYGSIPTANYPHVFHYLDAVSLTVCMETNIWQVPSHQNLEY